MVAKHRRRTARLRTRFPNALPGVPYPTQFPHDWSWCGQKTGKMHIFFLFCPVDSERMFTAADKTRNDAVVSSEGSGEFQLFILFEG
jgi:hypothetical protein